MLDLGLFSAFVDEAADGQQNDEQGDDVGPDMSDARGDGDIERMGYKTLAREAVTYNVALNLTIACIDNIAWHLVIERWCHHHEVLVLSVLFFEFFIPVHGAVAEYGCVGIGMIIITKNFLYLIHAAK